MTRAERIESALRGILEIGKRDTSNPKYDGYFKEAREALVQPAPAYSTCGECTFDPEPAPAATSADYCERCKAGIAREYRTVKMPEPYGGTGWWHYAADVNAWFTCQVQGPAPACEAPPAEENVEFNAKWHLASSNRLVDGIDPDNLSKKFSFELPGETRVTGNVGAWYHSAVYWKHRWLRALAASVPPPRS